MQAQVLFDWRAGKSNVAVGEQRCSPLGRWKVGALTVHAASLATSPPRLEHRVHFYCECSCCSGATAMA